MSDDDAVETGSSSRSDNVGGTLSLTSPTRRRRVAALVVVLALGVGGLASAQPQAPPEPPPRFDLTAQFTFLGTTGNSETSSLGLGAELAWRPDPWEHLAKAKFVRNETDDVLSARSFVALYRASRRLNERLSAYGQYDFQRDIFAGIEQRHIVEGGLSYLAIRQPRQRLRFDAGLGYLYENHPLDEHFDSMTISLGARYEADISATAKFTYEPRYLVTVSDAGAYRFEQEAALTAALTSLLSLKLSHSVRYSAQPPVGFTNTDTIAAVSLVAKIRRAQ